MDSYTMIPHPCQHGFYLAHANLLKSPFFSYYLPKSKIVFLKIPQGHDIPRGKTSYVPLQHPLRQQQQHETRQPQNADGQGVQQVQSQRNTGNGSGGVHRPQSQKAQCRIHQQLQGKAQGRPTRFPFAGCLKARSSFLCGFPHCLPRLPFRKEFVSFPFRRLNARVKSVIRRRQAKGDVSITVGNLLLYPDKRQVEVGGVPLQLNRKEFDLLYYFIVNPNRVINKMSLAESVWGDNIDQADSLDFIYSQVKNLRRKLKQADATVELKAVYGFGYKLSES